MSKVDLHLQSNCSDGSDNIKELYKKIKQSGLKVFALTDHDTVEGCAEMQKLVSNDIIFVPSVELTCIAGSIKCHNLGYNCDYENPILLDLIAKGKGLRRQKLETRIKYLEDTWNIVLTPEELDWLYSRKSVVKTHIANILVKRGLAPDNLSAMAKFLDGCKSGDTRFTAEEAISAIIASGGIPIWAHPLGGEGEKHLSKNEFLLKLKEMLSYGIRGLECYYSRYSIEESEFLLECTKNNGLLVTGGSDYHGSNKNNIKIGELNVQNKSVEISELTVLESILNNIS